MKCSDGRPLTGCSLGAPQAGDDGTNSGVPIFFGSIGILNNGNVSCGASFARLSRRTWVKQVPTGWQAVSLAAASNNQISTSLARPARAVLCTCTAPPNCTRCTSLQGCTGCHRLPAGCPQAASSPLARPCCCYYSCCWQNRMFLSTQSLHMLFLQTICWGSLAWVMHKLPTS